MEYNVRAYGALGDGKNDDRLAIQRAIDAAAAAGGGTVTLPAGKYRIGSFVRLASNVSFIGAGSTAVVIDIGDAPVTGIEFPPLVVTALPLESELPEGGWTYAMNNTAGRVRAGDFIRFVNGRWYAQDNWAGRKVDEDSHEAEMFEVTAASARLLTFNRPAVFAYTRANALRNVPRPVEVFRPARNITIKGITVRKDPATVNTAVGIGVVGGKDVALDDIVTQHFDNMGIRIAQSVGVTIGTTGHVGGSDSLGLDYGLSFESGAQSCSVQYVSGDGLRHVVAAGGGWAIPMFVNVVSGHASNSRAHAWDTHMDSAFFHFGTLTGDRGASLSGIGHTLDYIRATDAGSNPVFPYKGGLRIRYGRVEVEGGRFFYTNEALVDCSFEYFSFRGSQFDTIGLRGSSRNIRFGHLRIENTRVASAASAAEASRYFGELGFEFPVPEGTRIDSAHIEGLPVALTFQYPGAQVRNVVCVNCGWNSDRTEADALIRITNAPRTRIDGVTIRNTNRNLSWTGRTIRCEAETPVPGVEIRNVSDADSPIVSYYPARIQPAFDGIVLENNRLRSGGGPVEVEARGRFEGNSFVPNRR